MKKRKKAVSPIISTVLLIMIVIILAIIILLWSRGFIKEAILKTIADQEKRIEQYCSEVKLQPIINNDGTFGFQNIGVVPIYQFDLKLSEKDSGETITEKGGSVNPQFSVMFNDEMSLQNYEGYEKIKIIPISLGTKKSGETEPFTCPETDAINLKETV